MSVLRFSDVFKEEEWNSRCVELRELETTGLCVYTDGGYKSKMMRPNASWALHSYFYKEGKPVRTARYKSNFPTKEGYSDVPSEKSSIVNSLKIYNASGLIRSLHTTNNIAELQAFILAIDLVIKTDLKNFIDTLRLFSDSAYVLDGASVNMANWKARGWKLSSGQPVQNLDYWLVIDEQLRQLDELNINVAFKHVAGHVDYGNIIVDKSCSLAMSSGIEVNSFNDEEWYHSKEVDIEPFLVEQRYLHFPGLTPGYDDYIYMFSMFDTKLQVSQIGSRLEDISFSIIKSTNEETLENLKVIHRECVKLEEEITPVPMVVDLKNMLSNKFSEFLKDGQLCQLPRVTDIDKITISNPVDESVVVQVISPPRNSFKALIEYQKGVKVLRELFANETSDPEPQVWKTDITNLFYAPSEKKEGLDFLLKTEDCIEVDAEYRQGLEILTSKVILTIGLDTPRRRVLHNLSNTSPKISVVTWDRGDSSFRYGVLVETDDSYGFWFTPYANTSLLI